jgi:hypothetical protein
MHSFCKPELGYRDHLCLLQSPSTRPSSPDRHFLDLPMLEPHASLGVDKDHPPHHSSQVFMHPRAFHEM